MITIDASVFVAAVDPADPAREDAAVFLAAVARIGQPVHLPTLAMVEVAAAIARKTGDADLARDAGAAVLATPGLVLHVLDASVAAEAAAVATRDRLRGADAIYVATAVRTGSVLVTLDVQVQERAQGLVVRTPQAWLAG